MSCENKTAEEKIECNGGCGCCIYRVGDTLPSFDKGGHRERSIVAQPNHEKHWNKIKQDENFNNRKQGVHRQTS